MKASFTSKAEYLIWRNSWKSVYRQLSKDIRETKAIIKAKQKNREYAGNEQSYLVTARRRATELLEERKQSKVLAQQLYLASRQALQQAPAA